MLWLLLLLVVVAAAFGVLGIVLKATLVVVLTIVFTIVVLVAIAGLLLRHKARQFRRELDRWFPDPHS